MLNAVGVPIIGEHGLSVRQVSEGLEIWRQLHISSEQIKLRSRYRLEDLRVVYLSFKGVLGGRQVE